MERLTYRTPTGFALVKETLGDGRYHLAEERLAAYEDTGLTPERCAELAKAEQEGWLAELSVPKLPLVESSDAVDSDVYCPRCEESLSGRWLNYENEWRLHQCPYCGQSIDETKTITRQEAEKALESEDE